MYHLRRIYDDETQEYHTLKKYNDIEKNILQACISGDLKILKRYNSNYFDEMINKIEDNVNRTSLLLYSIKNKILKYIDAKQYFSDVNFTLTAFKYKHIEIIKYLYENMIDNSAYEYIIYDIICEIVPKYETLYDGNDMFNENEEIILFLLSYFIKLLSINNINFIFKKAVYYGNLTVVKYINENIYNSVMKLSFKPSWNDNFKNDNLFLTRYAIQSKNLEIVKYIYNILHFEKYNIKLKTSSFQYACKENEYEIAKYLLDMTDNKIKLSFKTKKDVDTFITKNNIIDERIISLLYNKL